MTEDVKTITCSKCGAPIEFKGESVQIKCGYCGAMAVVPAELRQPEVVLGTMPPPDAQTVKRVVGGVGCITILTTVIPILIVVGLVIFLVNSLPNLLTQIGPGLIAPGSTLARLETSFGGKGTGPGLFQDVRHIAIDGTGNVYAAEYDTLRIQKFDNAGKYVSGWTIDENPNVDFYRKHGPDAIAADGAGNVYALWDRSLLKYDGASGNLLARFPLEKQNLGQQMVVYKNTLLAFADTGFDDTLVWIDTQSGQVTRRVPKLLSSIADDSLFVNSMYLGADGLGNLFVLYAFSGKNEGIYRFSPEGKYVDKFSPRPIPTSKCLTLWRILR